MPPRRWRPDRGGGLQLHRLGLRRRRLGGGREGADGGHDEERADGVKVSFDFEDIADETREAVKQYSADMAYLKDELREATEPD